MTVLPIIHFNDVYRVQPFKLHPKSPETIDVTQWAAMLDDLRDQWPERPDGKRDGLVLFSGDVFSPSVESSVTRGSHMVSAIQDVLPSVATQYVESRGVDATIIGPRFERNCTRCIHDRFDVARLSFRSRCLIVSLKGIMILTSVSGSPTYGQSASHISMRKGYPHLTELIKDTNFVRGLPRARARSLYS